MTAPAIALTARLAWLPAHGIGFYPVREAPYDAAYFAKYEGYAATEQGRAITAARLDLVLRHMSPFECLTDVGIGCGAFVETARALPLEVYGCDINPAGISWLLERGLFLDPEEAPVDALTFWDSLEHIPNAAQLLKCAREWVFCSLPIVPGDGPPSEDWKHFRPTEHCWYWTHAGFLGWMADQGFTCVEANRMETDLGREDIGTFAFRRVR